MGENDRERATSEKEPAEPEQGREARRGNRHSAYAISIYAMRVGLSSNSTDLARR